MYVIIYGDLFDGLQGVVGPFDTKEKAEDYMECYNLEHFEKAVYELETPESE